MDVKSGKIDETIINSLLQSNDLKEIIKKLVQGEIQNSGNQESAIQKLSEIFSLNSLCESNTQFKPPSIKFSEKYVFLKHFRTFFHYSSK